MPRVKEKSKHLSCSIPELKPHCPVIEIQRLAEKVDAYRGLVRVIECVIHESMDQGRRTHSRADAQNTRTGGTRSRCSLLTV